MKEGIVYQGDCLRLLSQLAPQSIDAIITDPPYSSGGLYAAGRKQATSEKYVQHGQSLAYTDFSGDNRDQRSWVTWMACWLGEALPALKTGAYVMLFTDWRQLPACTDAIQAGGIIWRGIAAWDKTEGARAPHPGYFKHQCEYVVWGTHGSLEPATHGGPWKGCYRFPVLQADKHHMTGKPRELMRELVQVVRPGGLILDPFAGSGTTGVACVETGRRFLGFELLEHNVDISNRRIAGATPALTAVPTVVAEQGGIF